MKTDFDLGFVGEAAGCQVDEDLKMKIAWSNEGPGAFEALRVWSTKILRL